MSGVLQLVREDLRSFAGYSSARSVSLSGEIWLNANESPWANPADTIACVRRYPEPQPSRLRVALADLYGVEREQLLIGRGSDEAIDLLIRALCAPTRDAVLITPPVFGMYAVCARLQGVRIVEVPLRDEADDFRVDIEAIAQRALAENVKIVFLCSPGNPAGGQIPATHALALAQKLDGSALVVIDEAYVEFAHAPSLASEISRRDNLAVLRTLSKAHALAAARIGCVIANPALIEVLQRCQAPYPVPAPCSALALEALTTSAIAVTRDRVEIVKREREALRPKLHACSGVRRVYPSQGNFLLVRFDDAAAAFASLLASGVVVREQRDVPQLGDALRISIGSPGQNRRVFAALDARRMLP
ncbi:MAG: histidinol-phosphate transaminase [Rudaea sp.]